ncbi:hypothetical protein Bbelb_389840 [Branchiostoma belcheri]|nr:hypothetical protein Bbelb_389840 [Branchiostoma belcheri]
MERTLHFIRVGKSLCLKMELRVLPVQEQTTWFTCEHQHEVVTLLRGVIEAKLEALRVRGKALDKVTAQQDPDIITGATLRVAYCFKKNELSHTFLVDTSHLDNNSTDISSDEEQTPSIGGSYRSFKLENVRLVACVCQYSSEYPQTLPNEKLVQGLSQIPWPQRETTDISNYFSRAPEKTTTSTMPDGPQVPVAEEKNRTNLRKMMKRGKLQKKNSKRKNHQIQKDTASSSHMSDSKILDQNVPNTTRNGVQTQTEDITCDQVEMMSDWSEDAPSDIVPADIKMIVREGTSEEITNAVARSCQESNTFPDSQKSQVGDMLSGELPKKKRGRPKKNKAAAPSVSKDGDVKMHKMRTNGSNSVARVTEDGHKVEAKGVDTMVQHQDSIGTTNSMTSRGFGMLEIQNTEDHKNVVGNDPHESQVQDRKDIEKESSHFSGGGQHQMFLDTSHDARENKHLDADRSTMIPTSAGSPSLDSDNRQSSDLRIQFKESAESSLNIFKTSKRRTKRKSDSPLIKQPSKFSKLSRKKSKKAVRKNCFDTSQSRQDTYDESSSQEKVEDEDKKQKSSKKQTCGTATLPTPSSTATDDDYGTANEEKMDSESCSGKNQNQSEPKSPSKNFVGISRNSGKRSSKHPSSQEKEASRRLEKIHRKMKKMEISDDEEDELHSDVNKGLFSQQDTDSSQVSAGSDGAIAVKDVTPSKSQQKPSTHNISLSKRNLSPVVKLVDISQAEQFRRLLSPVRERAKELTSSQGSEVSKKAVVESRSQDSHHSKQHGPAQIMRKRLEFRRQRSKVFDLDSAETLGDEDHNRSSFEGKTRKSRSTVFDQDLDSCPNVSEEYAVSSQNIEAKDGGDTNWTSKNPNTKRHSEKATVNSFEGDGDEKVVDDNDDIPSQTVNPSTSKRAGTMKKSERGKKSKVVIEPNSKDNRPSKRSSKAVSRPSQEVRQGDKRQEISKSRVSKKTKVRDDPDSGSVIVDEENTTDIQNGNSTVKEAIDVPEDDVDEICFVDEWQTGDKAEMENSIKKIRHVKDLNSEQIRYLVQKEDRYLKDIFKGKLFCRRHEDYKRGGIARADLDFQVRLGMFHESQHDEVLDVLNARYCPAGNNKYLDYVFKVLLPEALIKIHMDITGTSHDESEDIMQQALSRRSLCASMSMSD